MGFSHCIKDACGGGKSQVKLFPEHLNPVLTQGMDAFFHVGLKKYLKTREEIQFN